MAGAQKNVLAGIELIRRLLLPQRDGEPGLYFFRDCTETVKQLRAYRWKKGTGKTDPKPEPVKYYDHLCDSLRYIIYSRQLGLSADTGPFKPLAIKKKDRGLVRGWRP